MLIEPGEFVMGSRETPETVARVFREQASLFQDEHPQHRVRVSQPFYMGATEVTWNQFRQFVEATGYKTDAERDGKGGDGFDPSASARLEDSQKFTSWRNPKHQNYDTSHPVVLVSWNDAQAFCNWRTKEEGVRYRLPTEAEWEYAARAGTNTRYWTGSDPESMSNAANGPDATYREHEQRRGSRLSYTTLRYRDGFVDTAPVASFRPNPFGLYDIHGNVWEWCADSYDANAYRRHLAEDPVMTGTDLRVMRGGCYM